MVFMSFNKVLLWKLEFFEKMIKRYELSEFRNYSELTYDAYMHMLLWSYVSSVYAWLRCLNVYFVLSTYLQNVESGENRWTLLKCGFMTG